MPAVPARWSEGSSPSSTTSQMVQLAQKIAKETEKLDNYLSDNGLPNPGFDVDAPEDFPALPEDMQRSRQEIVHATKELHYLVQGPKETVRWGIWSVSSNRSCQTCSIDAL